MLNWFATARSTAFGEEIAAEVMAALKDSVGKPDAKFGAKAEKALVRVDRRIRDFRTSERMNVYKRAKLANAFLWTLKDKGCPDHYAQQLTEWLSFRL